MNKYVIEFIGTFFLMVTIGCTVVPGAPGVTAPLRCAAKDVIPYWIWQFIGAALAAAVVGFLYGTGRPMSIGSYPKGRVAEFLFTFAVAFVVLNVATAKGTANNSFYGVAIAVTVLAGAFAVGGISGGAMMKILAPAEIWIHLVADLAGGAVVAPAFKIANPDDKRSVRNKPCFAEA